MLLPAAIISSADFPAYFLIALVSSSLQSFPNGTREQVIFLAPVQKCLYKSIISL